MDEELMQNDINNNDRDNMKNAASERLANASFVLGILSLFSVFFCCPFVLSAIGITLALLSKGASEALKPKARTGLILSIVGIVISVVVVIGSLAMPLVMARLNPEIGENFKKQYLEVIEQNEDFYRQTYGDETVDMMEEIIKGF